MSALLKITSIYLRKILVESLNISRAFFNAGITVFSNQLVKPWIYSDCCEFI